MTLPKTRLERYDNSWYDPGAGSLKRLVWYFVNVLVFNHGLFPFSSVKTFILRMFGAKVGKSVVIKPSVNIKYPWLLKIGDHAWIGENVWIDNLACVDIGSNCCLSQGSFILCGNHNYKKETFDLMVESVVLGEGAWLGAKSILCPGSTMEEHSILTAGSVGKGRLDSRWIYQGNPAEKLRQRIFEGEANPNA